MNKALNPPEYEVRDLVREIKDTTETIPPREKALLSLEEAAAYFGIGINKLREMTNTKGCKYVLFNGNKRMIKRQLFEKYLENAFSI